MSITSKFEATKAGRRPLLYRSKDTGAIYIKDPNRSKVYTRLHSVDDPLGSSFEMEDYQVEPVYGKLVIEVTP